MGIYGKSCLASGVAEFLRKYRSENTEVKKEPCSTCDTVHNADELRYNDGIWEGGLCEDCYDALYRKDMERY